MQQIDYQEPDTDKSEPEKALPIRARQRKYLHAAIWAVVLLVAGIMAWFFRAQIVSVIAPPAAQEATDADSGPFKVSGDVIEVPPDAAKTLGLQTTEASIERVPVTLQLTGRTGLNQEAITHIRGQFPGRVVDIGPALGSQVYGPDSHKGPTTMCVVESTDLAQAKSAYYKAKITYQVDQDALHRTQELFDAKVLAEKFLLDAKSTLTKDEADFNAARQQLLIFGLKNSDLPGIEKQEGRERMVYAIPCPRTGIITEKNVTRGELADPTVNLFTIADLSRIWIYADVYERDRRRVREGQKMEVIVASHPDEPRDCKVEWISPVLDATTRSVRIRGSLDNRDGRLMGDMYCTVILTVDDKAESVILPAAAVVHKSEDAYAFVRTDFQKGVASFTLKPVKVEPVGSGIGFETPAPATPTTQPFNSAAVPSVDAPGAPNKSAAFTRLRVIEGVHPGDTVITNGALGLFSEMEQQQTK